MKIEAELPTGTEAYSGARRLLVVSYAALVLSVPHLAKADIHIHAKRGNHTLYSVKWTQTNGSNCKLSVYWEDKIQHQPKVSEMLCRTLSKLSTGKLKSSEKIPQVSSGEKYTLIHGKNTYRVLEKGKETCAISTKGTLNCQKNKLDSAEKILHLLKPYGHRIYKQKGRGHAS